MNFSGIQSRNNSAGATELDIFAMLRRRWNHLCFGGVIGLGLAALYLYATVPTYTARIEILVGQRSSEMASTGTMSSAQASGDLMHEDQLATHMQLLASRKVIGNAINQYSLRKIPSIAKTVQDGGNAIDYILDNLEITRGGQGSAENAMVLAATFVDPSPDDAARVLEALYDAYSAYVESHSRNTSDEAAKLIEAARVENEKELVKTDEDYRRFIQTVPVLLEGERVRDIHKTRLDQLEAELSKVRASLAESKSRLEVIRSFLQQNREVQSNDFDSLALLSQKETERLKLFLDVSRGETQSEKFQAEQPVRAEAARAQYNRLLDLLQKERTLIEQFGESHPLIESTRQEILVIKTFITDNAPQQSPHEPTQLNAKGMLSTFIRLLQNDVAEYEIRVKLLVETSSEELIAAKKVEGDFLEGTAKKAKLIRAQARYDEVIRRLQEINLTGSYAGFSTDLLAAPEAPASPSWPKLPIVVAIGLLLGVCIGGFSAITSEVLDSTFRDVEDLEHALGAPAIAHVPRFNLSKLRSAAAACHSLAPSLVAAHSPRSSEAEVYRVARTSLMIKVRSAKSIALMMSSPHPGDGKSTTISNLAISFAQTGKRVLLIDTDLRRPVIGGLFGVENAVGVADVLSGLVFLEDALIKTPIKQLSLLTHGTATPEPAELLQSPAMASLVDEAKRHFDIVLIDAPPLLAVADPSIVAPLVDGVVLAVRITKNGRRAVERAGKVLSEIGITPLALIVNAVDHRGAKSYGYGLYQKDEYGYIGKYHQQYSIQEPPVASAIPLMPSLK